VGSYAAIHVILVGLVLGWVAGLVLGILHMLIDTRQVFRFWRRLFRMTEADPMGTHVAIWTDQVLHVLCIAAWVQFVVPQL
jgi:succinate dehydrogenase/fumarate reductase cytochrome b subunit